MCCLLLLHLEQHDEALKKAQTKQNDLLTELEETKSSLQKAEVWTCNIFCTIIQNRSENFLNCILISIYILYFVQNTCKGLETELQTAVKTLIQVTEQKEATIEEFKEFKGTSASVIDDLQAKVSSLKELLEKEEMR